MKSQRSLCTLPALNDVQISSESEELTNLPTFNNIVYLDTNLPLLLTSDSENLIPCYVYSYPLLQIPCDPYQSLTSSSTSSLAINPYESCIYLSDCSTQPYGFISTSSLTDSGYMGGLTEETFLSSELELMNINDSPQEYVDSSPTVTSYGSVSIMLRHLVRVDISPNNAIYISVVPADCVAVVNKSNKKSCIIHPNGRVFHDGFDIHMTTLNRKAKICKKGVIFTSSDLCLSYLVDESGTKTTAERFRDLSQDFSFQVFCGDIYLEDSVEQCVKIVENSYKKVFKNGDEIWIIGGFRIKQDQWGDIKVTDFDDSLLIKASPTNGEVTIKSDTAELSVGRYPNNYLHVRKDSHFVSASLRGFSAQSGTQRAGINNSGKVVLH